MRPLIDADVLRMEVGSVGQHVDEEGNIVMRSWDFVEQLLDGKIHEICELTWSDEPPVLFLTSCPRTHKILHRKGNVEFQPNFREDVAVTKPYKGTRKGDKPLHYDNITAYMINCFKCIVAEGCEADDLLAYEQTKALARGEETIICTRDKDLRMVQGHQFGWACGKQEAYGPRVVSVEEGLKTFCMQMLTGDTVDNIPGVPRIGPKKAADILEGKETYEEMLKAVREAYRAFYGDAWADHMTEQGKLLWMCTEFAEGKPVQWKLPEWVLNEQDTSKESKTPE